MNTLVVRSLRVVIVVMHLGVLVAQAIALPEMAASLAATYPEAAHLRGPVLTVSVVGLTAAHVSLFCVWRLLTMVRRDTVFSARAFRWVDVIIGAAGTAGVLAFALLLWLGARTTGTGIPPGITLVLLGAGVVAAGAALLVGVLRALLRKAVGLEHAASTLRAELDEVI